MLNANSDGIPFDSVEPRFTVRLMEQHRLSIMLLRRILSDDVPVTTINRQRSFRRRETIQHLRWWNLPSLSIM